jgi:putative two-component system response regulator
MFEGRILTARILMVDDEEPNLQLLRRILEPVGFDRLEETTDPFQVLPICRERPPDLVLLDIAMPGKDGFQVLAEIREHMAEEEYLPVLILTSDHSPETKRRSLSAGAQDFLNKPLSPAEVRLRVKNLLQTRFLHLALRDHNRLLEERVRERTAELEDAHAEILARLARAAEFRDDQTGEHTRRVGRLSGAIARELGLHPDEISLIQQVAPLHDVGKIGIPDDILLSPKELTPSQVEVMRSHTEIGGDLMAGSGIPLLDMAEEIARTHHERWDGTGYPDGLSGDDIPIAGRIVAVADSYDAVAYQRRYKPAWTAEDAWWEIARKAGADFDPTVIDAFTKALRSTGLNLRDPSGGTQ